MGQTQEEKLLGGLAHIGVLFGWIGIAFQVVLLVAYKPKSRFVFDHAKQAAGLWVLWYLFKTVAGMVMGGLAMGAGFAGNPYAVLSGGLGAVSGLALGGLILGALGIGVLILVILAAIRAFKGQEHRYPVIGDMVAGIGE